MNKDITLEDLGYKCKQDNVSYKNLLPLTNLDPTDFYFNNQEKELYILKNETMIILNIKILQAIYNKCKELEWFDE